MPHETSFVSKVMLTLRDRLDNLLSEMEETPSDKSVYFADFDEVPEEFLDSLDKSISSRLLFHFGVISVTGSPSNVHEEARSAIGDPFLAAISSVVGDCTTLKSVIKIVNSFACGKVVAKAADLLVVRKSDGLPLLAGEVAYSHESLEEVFLECIHFLTEYTTPWYSVGMKIRYRGDFLGYLFLLERLEDNAPENEALYRKGFKKYKEKVSQSGENLCKKKFSLDENMLQDYFSNMDEIDQYLLQFGVKIIYYEIITRDNYFQDRYLSLPRYNITVCITKESIARIVEYYLDE